MMFRCDMFSGVCFAGGDSQAVLLVMISSDMFFLLYVLQAVTVSRFFL